MTFQDNWTMDKLLKKVYALHKQSLNDATADLMKCKEGLQRSEERIKDLETQNDHLMIENRRLSTLEDSKQTSSGSCCEVIRQSLQMVITSYKELLDNKDQRIKELEDQLGKYKRKLTAGDSLNWTLTEELINNRRPRSGIDHSPDSTSRSTPVCKTDPNRTQSSASPTPIASAGRANIVDKGESKSLEEINSKKRLQRRIKRSRYSEEVSPETKRPRLKAGNSSNGTENIKQNKRVIVENTCHSEKAREIILPHRETGLEETVLIVPETLAVDGEHSDGELDDEDIRLTQHSGKKLFRIDEKSESLDHDIDNDNHVNESKKENELDILKGRRKEERMVLNESKEEYIEVGRSACKSSGKVTQRNRQIHTDRSKLKSILSSPEMDGHSSENDSLYEAISDIGANVIDDLEGTEEKLLSQQEERNLNQSFGQQSSSSHSLGGRCKNMDEVNELFETPASKGNQAKQLDEEMTGNKKRLFKNSLKNRFSQEDVILRRSPRKRKDLNEAKEVDTVEPSGRRSLARTGKSNSSGESDENDLTIAPEPHESMTITQNQSMDLYHIVPVKNGQPITSKQFDVKIKKNKYSEKSVRNALSKNNQNPLGRPTEAQFENLENKSRSRIPEVMTISSPSVGSLSDPESPLLLKDNKKNDMNVNKTKSSDADNQNDSQTDGKKVNRSRSNSNRTNVKRNTSNKQQDDDDLKLDSPRSKSLRQTTLTQKFFSPDGKQAKNSKCGEKAKRSKKGLKLERDVKCVEEQIVVVNEDSAFKKPENPNCRQPLSLRKNGRHSDMLHNNDHQPLHDISSKHLNGNKTNLNGSLDPAAELTVLCREPDTEENHNIKSLPSLDTDFCGEDLMTGSESLPKTSTLAAEDCEDIPSSYKFIPKKKSKETANKENLQVSFDDSFDRPPKKQADSVPHIAVVRKKDERQKLQGYGCKQCEEYYKSAGRNDEEVKHHMNQCSRHRAQFLPPDTPPHFWSVGFIDTQECVDRGYIKVDENQNKGKEEGPMHRRRRKLNKYFRSKTEGTVENDSDEELVYE